jgi:hypothetical protein
MSRAIPPLFEVELARITNMHRRKARILVFSACLTLTACSAGAVAGNPTQDSESVLQTAQARAELTRQATFQTPPPTPIPPTATTPYQTATITPTLTPTPGRPILTADYNAYIRDGPDETYKHIGFLLEGMSAFITGRFDSIVSGIWYQIEQVEDGKVGWVWSGAVTFTGDADSIPEVEPPPK